MNGSTDDRVPLLGVGVSPLALPEVLAEVERFVAEGGRRTVLYVNVHCMNIAARDPDYRATLNAADLVYSDGYGITLGARLLGRRLPPRMTGADWIHDLSALAARRGIALYFLGSSPGVAERAAARLQALYPGIRIVGTHHGYLQDPGEAARAIEDVNTRRPDILLVGMGSPLQEAFIARHRKEIEVPAVWAVGALLDFVAGKLPRGPRWMLDHGLEWACRLWFEPRRLWRRYFFGNALFLLRIARARLVGEEPGPGGVPGC